MKTELIRNILSLKAENQPVELSGWVRTKRDSKNLVFLQVNDGSCFSSIQLTFDREKGISPETEDTLKKITTGTSVVAKGILTVSPGKGQAVEVLTENIKILGEAPAETSPETGQEETIIQIG